MAFRASTITLDQGLRRAKEQALWIKQHHQSAVQTLTGNVNSNQIFQLIDNTAAVISMLQEDASVPGIAAYAQQQFNDPAYNVGAEFTAMVNALQAVVAWVVNNFPKDANGFLLSHTINANGSRTPRVFTPAQTAGLTTALNNAIVTIS
jgi:hypothetical protein